MEKIYSIIFLLFVLSCSPENDKGTKKKNFWSFGDIPSPARLEDEKIGTKERVHNLFDRWTLIEAVHRGRGKQFAEVSIDCSGLSENDFLLGAEDWINPERRKKYYRDVDTIIENLVKELIGEKKLNLSPVEIQNLIHANKALAWQETNWQHFVKYKEWSFVVLSGGSYNILDDWGITQVARSGFQANELLNKEFFETKGYCSIRKTLKYGFLEFINNYIEARTLTCNQPKESFQVILGSYNKYSSGFSLCHDGLSDDPAFSDYQKRALRGFQYYYDQAPWRAIISKNVSRDNGLDGK